MVQNGENKTYAHQAIEPSMARVKETLEQGPDIRRVLFSVEHIHVHEFVIYLLDLLIKGNGWKGTLVSIDRPFNYITKLMRFRGINTERLTIIDIITSISTGSIPAPDNVVVLQSPFLTDLDSELVDLLTGQEASLNKIDMGSMNFLLFDNVAVLDHYIELIYLKRVFAKIERELHRYEHLKTVILLDIERQQKVYNAFQGWADTEIIL